MKPTSRALLLALVIAILAVPAVLFALSPAASSDAATMPGGHHHFGHGGDFAIMKQLNLTADQKTKIHSLMAAHHDQMMTQFKALHDAHTQLSNAINADKYDENAVRAASQAVSAAHEEMAVLHAQLANAVKPLLTPDQLAKAKQLRAQMQAKMEARFEKMQQHANPPSN